MVEHIGERSISELIPLFLSYENKHYEERKPEYLNIKLAIVDKIISMIASTQDPEVNNN